MRRPEFITPTLEIVKDNLVDDSNYCKLKISPLERGYGMTIGNSLRRVMLSSLPGAAIFAIEMDGVHHEFCAVEGVREDVTEIILNLKNVIFTINADKNLKAIDALINETVGASGTAWSGESAVAFKNSWDGIAEQFSSFVNDFNQQAVNIQTLLSGMQAVDTTESGTVNQ